MGRVEGEINICHKPTDKKDNIFNLFGHIHGRQMVKEFGLDVGVDAHNYKSISIDVYFYKTAIEKHYDRDVFI